MTDTSSQTGLDGRSDARVAILGLGYVGHVSNDRLRAALAGRLSVDPAKRSFQASRPCTCPAIHERIAPLPCCARE